MQARMLAVLFQVEFWIAAILRIGINLPSQSIFLFLGSSHAILPLFGVNT